MKYPTIFFIVAFLLFLGSGCEDANCIFSAPPEYKVTELTAPDRSTVGTSTRIDCKISYGEYDCSDVVAPPPSSPATVYVWYSYSPVYCEAEANCFSNYFTGQSFPEAQPGQPQTDTMSFTPDIPGWYCCRVGVVQNGVIVTEKSVMTEVVY